MNDTILEINGLSKIYKSDNGEPFQALDDINLKVKKGSIVGLLGPNGAGKSTTINIIGGSVNKTSGQIIICNQDIDHNFIKAKYNIGIVPQELVLDPFFTPFEVLEMQAGLYGVSKRDRKTEYLLKAVGLEDKAHTYARKLSGGMRRRLMVAKALVHSPEIVILDEPTAGVDVELRQNLWNYITKLNHQGTTVILTTHYLEEAEALCDEIAIINEGKLITFDKTENLLSSLDKKQVSIQSRQTINKDIVRLKFSDLSNVSAEFQNDNLLLINYRPSQISFHHLLERLRDCSIEIDDMKTSEPRLEDVFVELTR